MSASMGNSSPLGMSTKFSGFGGGMGVPQSPAANSPIPQSTSMGVLTDAGQNLAAWVQAGQPSPVTVLIGFALLIALLKFASEHKSTAIDPADLHIGSYNLFAVTVTAIVGIATMKILFNWIQLPGITPLVNFI